MPSSELYQDSKNLIQLMENAVPVLEDEADQLEFVARTVHNQKDKSLIGKKVASMRRESSQIKKVLESFRTNVEDLEAVKSQTLTQNVEVVQSHKHVLRRHPQILGKMLETIQEEKETCDRALFALNKEAIGVLAKSEYLRGEY